MTAISKIIYIIYISSFMSIAVANEISSENYFKQGLYCYNLCKYKIAEHYFLKAYILNKDHPLFNHYLGKLYIEIKNYQKASRFLKKTYQNNSWKEISGIKFDILDYKYDKAYLHFINKEYSKSYLLYQEIFEQDTTDCFALYNIGLCFLMMKYYEEAYNKFEEVRKKTKSFFLNECIDKLEAYIYSNDLCKECIPSDNKMIYKSTFFKSTLTFKNNPGIITTIEGKDLLDRGVQSVNEALKMSPGFETYYNEAGYFDAVFRGISQSRFFDFIRIYQDGFLFQPTLHGPNAIVDLSINHVDQIQIIRGPASALNGEYGLLSAINIITQKKKNCFSSRIDDNKNTLIDGNFYYKFGPDNHSFQHNLEDCKFPFRKKETKKEWITDDIHVSFNISKNYKLLSGKEPILNYYNESIIPNNNYNNIMGLLNIRYKTFFIQLNHFSRVQGDYYGLYPCDQSPINNIQEDITGLAVHQNYLLYNSLYSSLYSDFNISFQRNRYNLDLKDINRDSIISNIYFVNTDYLFEDTLKGSLNFIYEKRVYPTFINPKEINPLYRNMHLNHEFMLGWSFIKSTIKEKRQQTTEFDFQNHFYQSLLFQDKIKISDKFLITGSLRYDNYNNDDDDVVGYYSPIIAAVYRFNNKPQSPRKFFIKLIYSQRSIPLSLIKKKSIHPSPIYQDAIFIKSIKNYEMCFMYSGRPSENITDSEIRMTLYSSNLDSVNPYALDKSKSSTTLNEQIIINGFELEIKQAISEQIKLEMNLSFSNAKNLFTDHKLENSIDWLSNSILSYISPDQKYNLSLWHRYVGRRFRQVYDSRDTLKGYHKLNLTAAVNNFFYKGLSLQAGIKNFFNNDIRYPSTYIEDFFLYPDDLPADQDRQYWIKFTWNL